MIYIINDTRDYADEFEYTIRSYLTQEKINCLNENRDFIISVFEETDNSEFECYFGTNQGFDSSISEIFDLIADAKTISEKEYSILKNFEVASLDIIDRVISVFLDHAYDLFDVEDASEEENQNMQKAEEIYRIMNKL